MQKKEKKERKRAVRQMMRALVEFRMGAGRAEESEDAQPVGPEQPKGLEREPFIEILGESKGEEKGKEKRAR